MFAEHRDWFARCALTTAPAGRRICELGYGGVHAGLKHFGGRAELRIFAVMGEIGSVAANRCCDRLAGLRMRPDFARQ